MSDHDKIQAIIGTYNIAHDLIFEPLGDKKKPTGVYYCTSLKNPDGTELENTWLLFFEKAGSDMKELKVLSALPNYAGDNFETRLNVFFNKLMVAFGKPSDIFKQAEILKKFMVAWASNYITDLYDSPNFKKICLGVSISLRGIGSRERDTTLRHLIDNLSFIFYKNNENPHITPFEESKSVGATAMCTRPPLGKSQTARKFVWILSDNVLTILNQSTSQIENKEVFPEQKFYTSPLVVPWGDLLRKSGETFDERWTKDEGTLFFTYHDTSENPEIDRMIFDSTMKPGVDSSVLMYDMVTSKFSRKELHELALMIQTNLIDDSSLPYRLRNIICGAVMARKRRSKGSLMKISLRFGESWTKEGKFNETLKNVTNFILANKDPVNLNNTGNIRNIHNYEFTHNEMTHKFYWNTSGDTCVLVHQPVRPDADGAVSEAGTDHVVEMEDDLAGFNDDIVYAHEVPPVTLHGNEYDGLIQNGIIVRDQPGAPERRGSGFGSKYTTPMTRLLLTLNRKLDRHVNNP